MKKSLTPAMAALAVALLAGVETAAVPQDAGNPVQAMVRRLELGRPVSHNNLTIIPVYLDKVLDRTRYVTLEDALKNGWITITEVEGGRVPQVRISNLSKQLVFLMGGEILTGCRQDRILAGDILLAPGTRDLLAPVFCVEQGRWTHVSQSFFSKQNLGTPALRAQGTRKIASGAVPDLGEDRRREPGDGSFLEHGSLSGRLREGREPRPHHENRGEDERYPRLHADTVGVVIGLGGEVVSADIFANPDLFLKQWPKILKSSALSSLGTAKGGDLDRNAAAAVPGVLHGPEIPEPSRAGPRRRVLVDRLRGQHPGAGPQRSDSALSRFPAG